MEKFLKYNITTKKQNSNLATYTISLLNKGFGITLGNAIRRTMLSSIPGSAPFAIKIPKVTHEYQAIVGIKEDVTQIILNIKKIVIEIDSSIISDESLNEMKIES
jgi:DNA-directed RNA polymerase subunit alpha